MDVISSPPTPVLLEIKSAARGGERGREVYLTCNPGRLVDIIFVPYGFGLRKVYTNGWGWGVRGGISACLVISGNSCSSATYNIKITTIHTISTTEAFARPSPYSLCGIC